MAKRINHTPERRIPGFMKGVDSVPCLYLVMAPDLTIVSASDMYIKHTMTLRDEIIGRYIFDVFPDNPDDPTANGTATLKASFERVLEKRAIDMVSLMRYSIPRPTHKGGGFEERFWNPVNFPVFNKAGVLTHIIHNTEDVTRLVQSKNTGEKSEFSFGAEVQH